jgi:hypothetical protein
MDELLAKIERVFKLFMQNAKIEGNKSAATRARTASTELRAMLKEFRAKSLESAGQ